MATLRSTIFHAALAVSAVLAVAIAGCSRGEEKASAPAPAVLIVPPSPTGKLTAQVRHSKYAVKVVNADKTDWTDCEIALNRKEGAAYTVRYPTIVAGASVELGWMVFADSEGKRFNAFKLSPKDLTITCRHDGELKGWTSDLF